MTRPHKDRGHRGRPSSAFTVVLLVVAALLIHLGASNLDRGIRAATADGTPGVFTATRLDCVQHPGHESCTCYGDYRAHDGRERREVYLYGGDRRTCRIGAATAAVDVGAANRVYGPEGSREWILTAVLLLAGLALLARTGLTLASALRTGRAPRTGPAPQPRPEHRSDTR